KGDAFQYELIDAPAGVEIHPRTGMLSAKDLSDGVYSFTIRATDLVGESTEQIHVLTVAPPDNLPPGFTSVAPDVGQVGVEYSYHAEATDPDGAEVVYLLSRSQPGMTIDGESGTVRWTPSSAHIGSRSVEITALDARGASSKQYFLINIADPYAANRPPVITSVPSGSLFAGKTFSYQVAAN